MDAWIFSSLKDKYKYIKFLSLSAHWFVKADTGRYFNPFPNDRF